MSTHGRLESTVRGKIQDPSKKRGNGGHLQTGEYRGSDKSGHQKKRASEQSALTNWRMQREGQVRTPRKIEREKGTYGLESAEARVESGHRKKANNRGVLTN
jgi:hypothetical protein